MNAFPWREVMAFGFGVLRLAPAEFWSMTPRELAAAMEAHGLAGTAYPNARSLAALMQSFPDTIGDRNAQS